MESKNRREVKFVCFLYVVTHFSTKIPADISTSDITSTDCMILTEKCANGVLIA
jgi:hypothetical protein